jgi:hypothetical protein
MIEGQIFTGSLLGEKHVTLLYSHPTLLWLAFLLSLLLIAYAVLHGPFWLKLMNLFAFLTFVAMLGSLKPLAGVNLWQDLANPGTGQRYWYIPMLTWIMTLVWLLAASKSKPVKTTAACLLTLLVLVGVPTSWRMTSPPNLHFQSYARRFQLLPAGTYYSIPTYPPGWAMPLHKK